MLPGEARLARLVQNADAEDDSLARFELRQQIAERARFLRAPRRVVLRVEIQNERPSRIVCEAVGRSVLILQRECGRLLPRLDERHCASRVSDEARGPAPMVDATVLLQWSPSRQSMRTSRASRFVSWSTGFRRRPAGRWPTNATG